MRIEYTKEDEKEFELKFNIDFLKDFTQTNEVKTRKFKRNSEHYFPIISRKTLSYIKSAFKKKSCIYCIKFGDGYKVGITNDMSKRLTQYTSPWCKRILSIYIINTEYKEVRTIEKYIIKKYKKSIKEFSKEYICRKDVDYEELVKHIHEVTFKILCDYHYNIPN